MCVEARFRLGAQELVHFEAVHAPPRFPHYFTSRSCTLSRRSGISGHGRGVVACSGRTRPRRRRFLYCERPRGRHCTCRRRASPELQVAQRFVAFAPSPPSEIWSLGSLRLTSKLPPVAISAELPKAMQVRYRFGRVPHVVPLVFVSVDACSRRRSLPPPPILGSQRSRLAHR